MRRQRRPAAGRRSRVLLPLLAVLSTALIAPLAAPASAAPASVTPATVSPTTWTSQSLPWTVPGPLNATVNDVVCLSKSACIGVGATPAGAFITTSAKGHWTPSVLAPPSGDTQATLSGLSCPTKTACTAVGSVVSGGTTVPLVAAWTGGTWAGGTWTTMALSSPGASGGTLESVSCRSPSSCAAVGSAGPDALIETSSAGTWSSVVIAPPTGQSDAILHGVSCLTTSFCLAVGWTYHENNEGHLVSSGFVATLADGSATSTTVDPSGGSGGGSIFYGLTCPGASTCYIVGASAGDSLVERWWHGLWTPTTGFDPTSAGGTLVTVSCPSTTRCVALGSYNNTVTDEPPQLPVSATLSHGTWTATEEPGLPFISLTGASCVSAHSCVAVGGDSAIATMTASGWTATRLAGPPDASLSSLSCPSAITCTAIGTYHDTADAGHVATETLAHGTWTPGTVNLGVANFESPAVSCVDTTCVIVSGNGAASESSGGPWTVTSLPADPDAHLLDIDAVSCTAATSCVAVGNGNGVGNGLVVATLSSTGWTTIDLPVPPGTTGGNLTGVSCQSATACVAVGSADAPGGEGLIETLSGTTWTPTLVAPPADQSYGGLEAVSCASTTSCVAVGSAGDGDGLAMVATLASGSWTAVDGFDNNDGSLLGSVSCATSSNCVAVGPDDSAIPWTTLALTLTGGTWNTTPVVLPSGTENGLLSAASCLSACQAVGSDQQTWPSLSGENSVFPMVATGS